MVPDPEEGAHVPYAPSPEDMPSEWSAASALTLENEFPKKTKRPAVAKAKRYPEAQKDMPYSR